MSIRVGITQGDINGVGIEVILKSLSDEGITELFTPVIFGNAEIFDKAKTTFGLEALNLNHIKEASQASEGKINLVDIPGEVELHPGEVRKDAGISAVEALETAVEALKIGSIDVLVTAPISKEAVQSENFNFPGHTEYLSDKLAPGSKAMMILFKDKLRVALQTIHLPMSQVAANITEESIIQSVEKLGLTLEKDFGVVRPKIAVLSLNPHAGDNGLLGTEENDVLIPAIENLKERGFLTFGPYPADGFFGKGAFNNFDAILAMYHDQGLAPFKLLAGQEGVNYSAVLPFIRTSPDHGTAYDIAWKGVADPDSMKQAIYSAIDIYRRRKNFEEMSASPLKKFVHERPERPERPERRDKSDLTDD